MANPVVHFEVVGTDVQKLAQFYGQLFGWNVDANNPMNYGMVEAQGGEGIGGGIGQGERPSVTFYVQVPDPQAALDQAVKLGGRVVQPVTEIPGVVTMAQFADPEGNIVGVVKG
jgi:predicted enzyme related to lactoylglutathione lyase